MNFLSTAIQLHFEKYLKWFTNSSPHSTQRIGFSLSTGMSVFVPDIPLVEIWFWLPALAGHRKWSSEFTLLPWPPDASWSSIRVGLKDVGDAHVGGDTQGLTIEWSLLVLVSTHNGEDTSLTFEDTYKGNKSYHRCGLKDVILYWGGNQSKIYAHASYSE